MRPLPIPLDKVRKPYPGQPSSANFSATVQPLPTVPEHKTVFEAWTDEPAGLSGRASPRRRPTGQTSIACSTLSCSCRRQICRRQFSATCDPTGPRVCDARASAIKRIVFVRLLQNHYFDRHFRCWGGGGKRFGTSSVVSSLISIYYKMLADSRYAHQSAVKSVQQVGSRSHSAVPI